VIQPFLQIGWIAGSRRCRAGPAMTSVRVDAAVVDVEAVLNLSLESIAVSASFNKPRTP
jgi:hypothetical protein